MELPPPHGVLVPHDRAGIVGHARAHPERAEKDVDVLAALGHGPGAEGLVEAAEVPEHVRAEGQVRPRAERAEAVREEPIALGRRIEAEGRGPKALAERGELLERHLRHRVEAVREDGPRDERSAVAVGGANGGKPPGVADDVVVEEGDDVASGLPQPKVAGARQPRPRLVHHADAAVARKALGHRGAHRQPGRPVLHHDDLDVVVVGEERADAPHRRQGVAAGRDHHGQGKGGAGRGQDDDRGGSVAARALGGDRPLDHRCLHCPVLIDWDDHEGGGIARGVDERREATVRASVRGATHHERPVDLPRHEPPHRRGRQKGRHDAQRGHRGPSHRAALPSAMVSFAPERAASQSAAAGDSPEGSGHTRTRTSSAGPEPPGPTNSALSARS